MKQSRVRKMQAEAWKNTLSKVNNITCKDLADNIRAILNERDNAKSEAATQGR